MERVLVRRKMMWVVLMLLPSLAFTSARAQDVLKLNLSKALEIALSENPTVKVADKEIEKKKYAQKGSYAALFPQISFAADYNRNTEKAGNVYGWLRYGKHGNAGRYRSCRYEQRD